MELSIKIGRTARKFKITYVSDAKVSTKEFDDWINDMRKFTVPLPTPKQLKQLTKHIYDADNYVWSAV